MSCLVCTEDFNGEVDNIINILSLDLGLKVVNELIVSGVKLEENSSALISDPPLALKLADQLFPPAC